MPTESQIPLYRLVLGLQDIFDRYPPYVTNPNKQVVFDLACPVGASHQGQLIVSRWAPSPLPETICREKKKINLQYRSGYFTYEMPPAQRLDWHLNFAHSDLFCAYGGPLFAQDEMQVAEHPICGSVRQALLDCDCPPSTMGTNGPTPILIQGVERRCSIATDPCPQALRPYGLYGNAFARASEIAIRNAVTIIDPPTRSNLIAIEAPYGRYGQYDRDDIQNILLTAYTGFRAACQETIGKASELQTAIHTGYWGCGAYGGNRELMAILQIIAATLADVHMLYFYTGDDSKPYERAIESLDAIALWDSTIELDDCIQIILDRGYEWGVSDGN